LPLEGGAGVVERAVVVATVVVATVVVATVVVATVVVGLVTVAGLAGPFETTSVTVVPRGTVPPALGDCLMTTPFGRSAATCTSTEPSFALLNWNRAETEELPTTFGTMTVPDVAGWCESRSR
jgi:hypothetical protein